MVIIKGFVTTTEDLASYGGISNPEETMENIAAALREGRVPFHADHDERNILRPRILTAEVRRTDTGALGVWAELEVQEEEYSSFSNLRGFSISIIEDGSQPDAASKKPIIIIGADAGEFDNDTFKEAVERLRPNFAVGGGRLYQFSEIPPAKVVIDLVWTMLLSVPPGILANALYDGLRCFLKPKRAKETVFAFRIKDGDHTVNFRLQTDNDKILSDAIASFRDIALREPRAEVMEFNTQERKWTKHL